MRCDKNIIKLFFSWTHLNIFSYINTCCLSKTVIVGNDMLLVCIYGGNHKPLPVSSPVPLPVGQTSTIGKPLLSKIGAAQKASAP